MIDVIDLKPGTTYEFENNIYQVIESQFSKSAMRQAHIKAKIKNLRTNSITSYTFTTGQKVKPAFVEKKQMQYLYTDGEFSVFMDTFDFQQYEVSKSKLTKELKFLTEGQSLDIVFFEKEILGVSLPLRVSLEVIECDASVKGNSVNNPQKRAVVETGLEVQVPMFVNKGEKIIIDTESEKYVSRA